ncbi:hypothetical protein KRR23_17850 [Pseudomonas sp. CVAP|uniref:hypothetical protein n=1 Tax=Pseudomonas sp. CVAP\|nr:hypothetical protein [Pseudomonas sp. CVAP\
MSFRQNKGRLLALIIAFGVLLVVGNYGFKIMTSIYKQDDGNGVVVYADDYVKTGQWVFDCLNSRLINRKPLPVPFADLEKTGKLAIGSAYLKEEDKQPAREALRAITGVRDWYRGLRYLYSGLDDESNVRSHTFDLVARYANRSWALRVEQWIGYDGKSVFTVTPLPYDPATYVDYNRALQDASTSCPVRQ